jgi:hypothetical protein
VVDGCAEIFKHSHTHTHTQGDGYKDYYYQSKLHLEPGDEKGKKNFPQKITHTHIHTHTHTHTHRATATRTIITKVNYISSLEMRKGGDKWPRITWRGCFGCCSIIMRV